MTRIYLSPPHLCGEERSLVADAFDSNWIAPLGPHVDAFESEMCLRMGSGHATALSSGTAALHLSLILLGVRPGDHVLCSTLTFAASANAIRYVGATPVFLDADRATWNLDPQRLAEALHEGQRNGRRPAALIAVDLYGQCADYDEISALCQQYEVPLVEDAAEALGATYRGRPAGTFGAMATLSFNGNKIITCGGGGMLLSSDKRFTDRARFLATQAREPFPYYQHQEIGYNYRLSNVLAAIGRAQLRILDERVAARRANNLAYRAGLADLVGLPFMPEASYGRSNCWLTCLTVDPAAFGADREALRLAFEQQDIEARPVWKPMHRQPVFSECRCFGGQVADDIFATGLCLPSGSGLTTEQRQRVIDVFHDVAAGRFKQGQTK